MPAADAVPAILSGLPAYLAKKTPRARYERKAKEAYSDGTKATETDTGERMEEPLLKDAKQPGLNFAFLNDLKAPSKY